MQGGIEQRVDHRGAQRRPSTKPYHEEPRVRLRRAIPPGHQYSAVLPSNAGPVATSAAVGRRKPAGATTSGGAAGGGVAEAGVGRRQSVGGAEADRAGGRRRRHGGGRRDAATGGKGVEEG